MVSRGHHPRIRFDPERPAPMLLRVYHVAGSRGGRRKIVIACDVCSSERELNFCASTLQRAETKLTFCSAECAQKSQQSGGLLRDQIDAVFQERYGVKTPLNLPSSREILRQSLVDGGLAKGQQTLIQRYGVDNPMRIPGVVEKQQNSIRNSRNGQHHFETSRSLERRELTCLKNLGYTHPMRSPTIIAKFPFKDVWRKSHEIKKQNGTYKSSRSERTFEAWLKACFGKSNVERGVEVNGWSIDFRVKIDDFAFYIQYDGVYWHGLDANEAVVRAREGLRARRIVGTLERDREQNKWFASNELLLFRTTDKDFERYRWQLRRKYRQRAIIKSQMILSKT
jgi:hypothetical protein